MAMSTIEWDPEAGASAAPPMAAAPTTKALGLPPPPRTVTEAFKTIAKLMIIATYVEDGARLVFHWEDQHSFVSRRFGYPLSAIVLFFIGIAQLCSIALLVPPTAHPALPKLLKVITLVIAASVLAQPFVFDQMDNFHLIIFSMTQLGALGLVFCNAHSTEYPPLPKSVSGAFASFVLHPSRDMAPSLHWASWMQLTCRLLLTFDLIVVFGERLLAVFTSEAGTLSTLTHVLIVSSALLVWLGVRTHYCATAAALAAFTDAFHRFPFWEGGRNAEFEQFHFFQAMTPVGGLLLLAAFGPGQLSFDNVKKSS